MIIGLTGKNASGKGEVAEILKKKGFIYYSLSDIIRDEIINRSQTITRENLIKFGNMLREKFGPSVLAQRITKKLSPSVNYVIDSIRNPFEIQSLRNLPGFMLINIQADPQTRFKRIKERKRENDPKTYKDFIDFEEREINNRSSTMQQLDECEKMADHIIYNNSTKANLEKEIVKLIKENIHKEERPDWDQYFMNIAHVAAQRSNCMKRRVASVIVKDKRIISTGYNGTPRGVKNCCEGGCPRCNQVSDSGKDLTECLCSHGEENAIVQAAYHGVSVKESTLYTTFSPCLLCTKMIINAGIREVVYNESYPMNDTSFKLLKQAKVSVRKIKEAI